MTPKIPGGESPNFNTLSDIMDYFNKVPFEIFKQNLTEWFMKELPEKRPDLIGPDGKNNLPPSLFNIIDNIFKLAEEKDQAKLN